MDWKVFFTTFVTIFLAEMGDKTQFAAFAASASSKSQWPVLLAVVLALSCAGVLGVLAGKWISEFVSPTSIRYVSGGLFVIVGLWILFSKN